MSEKEIHEIQKQIKELAKVQADANKLQTTANEKTAEAIADLKKTIQPMVDVYDTFSNLGRWGTKLLKGMILILTIISLIYGILFAIKRNQQ